MGSLDTPKKPHAVCIPYPAQGHINPMLKFAKLLHHKGFHITFVNTEYNHKRLLKSRGPDSLNGLPDFQFKTIPDGLPPSDANATQDIATLCYSTSVNCLTPLRNLINEVNNSLNSTPVSCVVYDGCMTFASKVAQELGIPNVLFWTASGCAFLGYLQYPTLVEKGLTPFKDENYLTDGSLEIPIDWIPGIQNIRLRDIPSFIRTTDPNDIMLNWFLGEMARVPKASAIVINTVDALEHDVLTAIKSELPPIYTIGSLHMLVKQISGNGLDSIGSNLWKEEPKCVEWLDTKEPNSVIYVNFGSIAVMTSDQLTEFAWGLANSKHSFLWVIRPDLVSGDSSVLSPEFIMETEERGLLVTWCSQEQVLSHPSVGAFLTHNGWNSTIESLSSGVPMICWPSFGDQQTNCRFACTYWETGMEIDNNVRRDEVESLVREMMEGEKGKEMMMKALKWKKAALEANTPGGSSYQNMDKFVKEIFLAQD